jgi:hypothetical protein
VRLRLLYCVYVEIELKISIEHERICLRAEDIALIFDVHRPAVVKHIGNIYKTNEWQEVSTCNIAVLYHFSQ